MYETFQLKSCGAGLMGYHWEAKAAVAVLCIIHGLGEHGGRYDQLAKEFVKCNISVLTMDLRGHGYSIGKRGHLGDRKTVLRDVDSLVALATRKYAHLPTVIYGHSLGGNLVMDYRLRGSLAAMPVLYIAASPWLTLVQKFPLVTQLLFRITGFLRPKYIFDANVNILNNDKLTHDYISARTLVENANAARQLLDPAVYDINKQRKPLIIMQGTEDKICSVEGPKRVSEMAGAACRLIEWKGYGHELHSTNGQSDGMAYIHKLVEIVRGAEQMPPPDQ